MQKLACSRRPPSTPAYLASRSLPTVDVHPLHLPTWLAEACLQSTSTLYSCLPGEQKLAYSRRPPSTPAYRASRSLPTVDVHPLLLPTGLAEACLQSTSTLYSCLPGEQKLAYRRCPPSTPAFLASRSLPTVDVHPHSCLPG